jgi:hypothetical protein
MVKYNRRHVYLVAIFLFNQYNWCFNKDVRSLIEDMPKNTGFYQDILFFENLKELCRWKYSRYQKKKKVMKLYLEKDG